MRARNTLLWRTAAVMLMALTAVSTAWAEEQDFDENYYEDYGLFDHLSLGVSAGTDGIGIEVAAPVTDYLALRAGVSFWPKLKVNKTIHIKDNNPLVANEVDLQAKLNVFDVKLLADFYPMKSSSFHLTAGAFLGGGTMVSATNTSMFIKDPAKYGKLGLLLGNYRITSDENGYVEADVKVNKLKPYLGIGFGRAVPKKSRVSVAVDMGVQFWGNPAIYATCTNDWGDKGEHKFVSDDLDQRDDKNIRDAVDIMEKLKVMPVLNIRITGRIF